MQFLICVNMRPTDSIHIIMQCYHACLHELQHWNVKTKPTLKNYKSDYIEDCSDQFNA